MWTRAGARRRRPAGLQRRRAARPEPRRADRRPGAPERLPTAALVTRDGAVDWWPGAALRRRRASFARLLDPDAGHFTRRARRQPATTTRALRRRARSSCAPSTASASGALRVTDALALAPGARGPRDRPRRARTRSCASLEAAGGDVEVEVELVPRSEYGLAVPRVARERGAIVTLGGPERLFLRRRRGARARRRPAPAAADACAPASGAGCVLQRVAGAMRAAPAPLDPSRRWTPRSRHGARGRCCTTATTGRTRDEVAARGARPAGADLPAHRRGRRGADDLAARAARRHGELGLPLRLAARREPSSRARCSSATCSDEAQRYFTLDGPRGRELPRELARADRLRRRGRAQPRGARARSPARAAPTAGRCGSATPRGARSSSTCSARSSTSRCALGDDLRARRVHRGFLCQLADRAARAVAGARRRHVGGARGARATTRSRRSCAGWRWTARLRLGDRARRARRRRSAGAARRERVRAAVLREAWSERRGAFTGDLRRSERSTPRCCCCRCRLRRRRRSAHGAHRSRRSRRARRRRPAAPPRAVDDEGAFLPATFWLAAWRAQAGDARRRARRRSSAPPAAPTTSACSPRWPTRRLARRSATCRRRSRTWARQRRGADRGGRAGAGRARRGGEPHGRHHRRHGRRRARDGARVRARAATASRCSPARPSELEATARELRAAGAGAALALPCDVADAGAVEAAADARRGRARPDRRLGQQRDGRRARRSRGTSTPTEFRRVTEVNYLGTVNGTLAALRADAPARPRRRSSRSARRSSYRAIPLQATYCAAKFAIRGFTDSVRTELLPRRQRRAHHDGAAAGPEHAAVHVGARALPRRPRPVAPVYQPEVAADAIVWAVAPSRAASCGSARAPSP